MQTQLQQTQSKSSTHNENLKNHNNNNNNHNQSTTTVNGINQQQQQQQQQQHQQQQQQQNNVTKGELKPVECNLCHRKFKNIPALNGHMRLHGGYFKKDSDSKKCDKKESNGPPLQTASVGVRALIEEKIINKRSKDLKVYTILKAYSNKTKYL